MMYLTVFLRSVSWFSPTLCFLCENHSKLAETFKELNRSEKEAFNTFCFPCPYPCVMYDYESNQRVQ